MTYFHNTHEHLLNQGLFTNIIKLLIKIIIGSCSCSNGWESDGILHFSCVWYLLAAVVLQPFTVSSLFVPHKFVVHYCTTCLYHVYISIHVNEEWQWLKTDKSITRPTYTNQSILQFKIVLCFLFDFTDTHELYKAHLHIWKMSPSFPLGQGAASTTSS